MTTLRKINEVTESFRKFRHEILVSMSQLAEIVELRNEFFTDFMAKSNQELKNMQDKVDKLIIELQDLNKSPLVDYTIPEFKEEEMQLLECKKLLEKRILRFTELANQHNHEHGRHGESENLGVTTQDLQGPLPPNEGASRSKNSSKK